MERNWEANWGGAAVKRSYWLEYIHGYHAPGFELAAKFAEWRDGLGLPNQSFWDYIKWTPLRTVKYYGQTAKAEKRRVVFKDNGKLHRLRDDTLFDTQALSTCFSGAGWAIFVVSPDGKMYAHKHVEGIYHHSTFLSGSAIMAAGELVVEQGLVKCITAKSGHYNPTRENMSAFVREFPQIPRKAVIIPDFVANPLPAYEVKDFRMNDLKVLKRSQVESVLPIWARGGCAGMLNKIAA